MAAERDYLERTIETVRNHRAADNCWPQWANIFADEIEELWAERDRLREALEKIAEHGVSSHAWAWCNKIAREALKEGE